MEPPSFKVNLDQKGLLTAKDGLNGIPTGIWEINSISNLSNFVVPNHYSNNLPQFSGSGVMA